VLPAIHDGCAAHVNGIAESNTAYYHDRMVTITCKVSEKLNAELEALARRRRVSKSAILREALESKKNMTTRSAAPSAYDLVRHLCGTLRGPKDVSTNPRHMKGFGE
jgi:hypothetical protein